MQLCRRTLRQQHGSLIKQIRRYQTSGLSAKQLENFENDGYIHIPSVWSTEICDKLRKRAAFYVDSFDPNTVQSVFTTNDQIRESDEYFLTSGDQIRCFFEEDAFRLDSDGKRELAVDKHQSINKIGHGIHDYDEEFNKHSYSPFIKDILKSLKYKEPVVPQSMYIFKQPSIGGEVRPHQDGTFLFTKPQSVIGFWWALEDCTEENGCLWGIPGSHKTVPIQQRFMRNPEGTGTIMEPQQAQDYDQTGAIPILTKKGDMVLLHHAFVHFSYANTSKRSRHAYAMHVVENYKTDYPQDNWLQLPNGKKFTRMY